MSLCNLDFTICGLYIGQVWPPLLYSVGCSSALFNFLLNMSSLW